MASNIDTNSFGFSKNYPVPGVNESSQGFRNNFQSIESNLKITKTEITNLQAKTLVISGDVMGTSSIIGSGPGNVSVNLTLSPNSIIPGQTSITIPIGPTSARNLSPINGEMRYNSTTSRFEGFENGGWINFSAMGNFLPLSGGTITGSLAITSDLTVSGNSINKRTLSTSFNSDNNLDSSWVTIATWDASGLVNNKSLTVNLEWTAFNNSTSSTPWNCFSTACSGWSFSDTGVFFSNTNLPVSSVTTSGSETVFTDVQCIQIGPVIQLQIFVSSVTALNFDLCGIVTLNWNSAGNLPLTITGS